VRPLVDEGTDVREDTYRGEEGDHELLAHYVRKDEMHLAILEGRPIKALCGKEWTPNRDPQRFPICGTCQEIINGLPE